MNLVSFATPTSDSQPPTDAMMGSQSIVHMYTCITIVYTVRHIMLQHSQIDNQVATASFFCVQY